MTISDGMYATLQLYWVVVAVVYGFIAIAFMLCCILIWLYHEPPEIEQAYLDRFKGE